MVKHFDNFPEGLEQYNPEIIQGSDFETPKTFDSQQQLHSFNDKPAVVAKVEASPRSYEEFLWYQHDKIYRENNQPPIVNARANVAYESYNENYELQSYDGMPSNIICFKKYEELQFQLSWQDDGRLHREGDLPATIDIKHGEIVRSCYLQNGLIHRDNGLPSIIEKTGSSWYVNSALHNSKGPAVIFQEKESDDFSFKWALFGIALSKDVFLSIMSYHEKMKVPLWVAVLCVLKVINESEVNTLKDEENLWNTELPVEWLLKVWGVDEEKFKIRINNFAYSTDNAGIYLSNNDESLSVFCSIVKIDAKQKLGAN